MIPPDNTCLAILAAGQSTRFGEEDKLTALLAGRMLGLHASATLAGMGWQRAVVIASRADHACAPEWRALGYDICPNPDGAQGLSTSVRLAVQLARESGAGALLICLADMPHVSAAHVRALLAAGGRDRLVASAGDGAGEGGAMPPALFGAAHFAQLSLLQGDQGARALLRTAQLVPLPAGEGADVDEPEDLHRLQVERFAYPHPLKQGGPA